MAGDGACITNELAAFNDRGRPAIDELLIAGQQRVMAYRIQDCPVIGQPVDGRDGFRGTEIAGMQLVRLAGGTTVPCCVRKISRYFSTVAWYPSWSRIMVKVMDVGVAQSRCMP